uniref:Putative phosphoinositide 3-kinase adapter protein 1 n=1 Tax=Ixodes ricinus TaxID=34613 RepID=A0A6B0VBC5_IXORI
MLCLTLGLATLHEVDVALAQNFRRNLPAQGFHLLGPLHQAAERKRSEEFLPTLLHFSAHYGLEELCSVLLQCPGALSCCHLLNCKGHCPAQLASSAGHHRLATVITDFQAAGDVSIEEQTQVTVTTSSRAHEVRARHSPPHTHYENVAPCHYESPGSSRPVPVCNPSYGMTRVPPETPEAVAEEQEAEYLSMMPFVEPPRTVPDPFHGLAGDEGPSISAAEATAIIPDEKPLPNGTEIVFSNTQEDLVKIIEMYKKGVPFAQIERLFDDWRKKQRDGQGWRRERAAGPPRAVQAEAEVVPHQQAAVQLQRSAPDPHGQGHQAVQPEPRPPNVATIFEAGRKR